MLFIRTNHYSVVQLCYFSFPKSFCMLSSYKNSTNHVFFLISSISTHIISNTFLEVICIELYKTSLLILAALEYSSVTMSQITNPFSWRRTLILFSVVSYDRSYCNGYSYMCLLVHLFSGILVSATGGNFSASHPCLSLTLRDSYSFLLGQGLGTSTKAKTNKKLLRQL